MTPPTEHDPSVDVQTAEMFDRLHDLDYACGPEANKHDRATPLIAGCIVEGVNTKSAIIGVMKHLGFRNDHIAKWLDMHTGSDPMRHWWQRDDAGIYQLLTETTAQ